MDNPLRTPPDFIKRFYAERIRLDADQTLTSTSLYEDYCCWCEDQQQRPLALPQFGQLFSHLGVAKARIAGRVRYLGIALAGADQPVGAADQQETFVGASVQTYCTERLRPDPQGLTLIAVYEDYAVWAEGKQQEPLSLPTFARALEQLGINRQRVAGRIRCLGIATRAQGA